MKQIKTLIIIVINLVVISCSKGETDEKQDQSNQLEIYGNCDTALFADLGFHFYRHKLGSNFRNFTEYYIDENDFKRAKRICYTLITKLRPVSLCSIVIDFVFLMSCFTSLSELSMQRTLKSFKRKSVSLRTSQPFLDSGANVVGERKKM